MKEFSVRILWGQAPDDEDKPVEYTFASQELLDAFMQGVEAAVGWLGMRVVEEEPPSLADTLKAAERFISGFEDDDMQEGVPALLEELRRAIALTE